MVGVRKVTVTSFRRSHDVLLHSVPPPCGRPPLTHASTGDSWTLTGESGQFLVGSPVLSPGSWCTQGFVCTLQESVFLVLCKFWCFHGGVNGE